MKKIIKKGRIPKEKFLTFECDACGTVFKADKRDYYRADRQNIYSYCPLCCKPAFRREFDNTYMESDAYEQASLQKELGEIFSKGFDEGFNKIMERKTDEDNQKGR